MSTIAVTGATGLIGAEVYEALARSHRVIRVGRSAGSGVRVDLGDATGIRSMALPGCDALVHCAGIVDEDVKSDPAQTWTRSTAAFAALIERALAAGARRFVYLSSAHVYGPLKGTITEDGRPDPRSDYALAHFAAEQTMKRTIEGRAAGLVLRPCAVFGRLRHPERFRRWSLIPFSFPREAATEGRIVLRSSGLQKRNFVSTGDVAAIVDAHLQLPPTAEWTVMNPVGPETLSVREFASRVAASFREITGRECRVEMPSTARAENAEDFQYETRFELARGREATGPAVAGLLRDFLHQRQEGSPA